MKKTFRTLALVMALMMVLMMSLTGCGKKIVPATAENLIKGAQQKSQSSAGLVFDGTVDMAISLSVFGQSEDVAMSGTIHSESNKDEIAHVTTKLDVTSSDGTDTQEAEAYVVKSDGNYITYTTIDGEWYKDTTDQQVMMGVSELLQTNVVANAKMEEKDTEYVVTTTVDITSLMNTFGDVMSLDAFAEDMKDVDLTNIHPAEITYHFDKETRDLLSLDVDMTAAMQDLLDASMQAMLNSGSSEGESSSEDADFLAGLMSLFQYNVGQAFISINNMKFDDSLKVVLPDAAKDAKDMPEDLDVPEIDINIEDNWADDGPTEEEPTELGPSVQITNPLTEFDTINAAASEIGFSIESPNKIGEYEFNSVYTINNEILELVYIDPNGSGMSVRKADMSVKDMDGDYNDYDYTTIDSFTISGTDINLKGQSEQEIYHVDWATGGFAYAMILDEPMNAAELLSFVGIIK